ncbi:hypothetical protein SK128_021655 [Halocaridina rubra]|uniref:Uncharacterized protein n=1 Tax=Halocaridina rubra TaxID=373956 RepID=A0AAN8XPC6_HALRR
MWTVFDNQYLPLCLKSPSSLEGGSPTKDTSLTDDSLSKDKKKKKKGLRTPSFLKKKKDKKKEKEAAHH